MSSATIHTGGGAEVGARLHGTGPHSFVAVRADHAHIDITRDGLSVTVGGPVALYLSPANALAIAEQILAAVPNEAPAIAEVA